MTETTAPETQEEVQTEESPMRMYIGTKVIRAKAMNRADYTAFRGWDLPENENGEDEGMLVEYLDGGKPNVEGFDGYISWSPMQQFINAYHPNGQFTFGDAQICLKAGGKVTRMGWNAPNQFVYRVPQNAYEAQTPAAEGVFGKLVPYGAYYALRNSLGYVTPWVPTCSDLEATDWVLMS